MAEDLPAQPVCKLIGGLVTEEMTHATSPGYVNALGYERVDGEIRANVRRNRVSRSVEQALDARMLGNSRSLPR